MSATPSEVLAAVQQVLSGNANAFSVITEAYMHSLYRLAMSLCHDHHTAEDLVQETLITGYLQLKTLRDTTKLGSWLHQILRNKYLNLVARTPPTESEEALYLLIDSRTPEQLFVSQESKMEFTESWRRTFASLSPALRETATLYFWFHLPMEQIAARQSIPLGTVKRRIHDAREQLKRMRQTQLEKEKTMDNQTKLPDDFRETVQKKVDELTKYHRIYGTLDGFDDAYRQVKELITSLSDAEDVKKFAMLSVRAATNVDSAKYMQEALTQAQKYKDVSAYSDFALDACWKFGSDAEKEKYTRDVILPTLATFPDGPDRAAALGYHRFWLAHYTDKTTEEGLDTAENLLQTALEDYRKYGKTNAMFGNSIAGQKAIRFLRDTRYAKPTNIGVTGECWKVVDGNIYYWTQPGCNYSWSSMLWNYNVPVFYFAGCMGDGYFFPKSISYTAGATEEMVSDTGEKLGWRTVVAVDETVITPAGTFTDCLHIRKQEDETSFSDIWYKEGVGIVKLMNQDMGATELLSSYRICGGSGYLPLAVGNTWCYEQEGRPDVIEERNEYVIEQFDIEQLDGEFVSLSCLNFAGLPVDWQEKTKDPKVLLTAVSQHCDKKEFEKALSLAKQIVMDNLDGETTAMALGLIEYLDEKLSYDAQGWRFCPSSVNGSYVTLHDTGNITYNESPYSFDTGAWGTRGEENGIFGIKPFRYLQICTGKLWDDCWVPGYVGEYVANNTDTVTMHMRVEDGGTVETPAGTFPDCRHLILDGEVDGVEHDYNYYFYSHTYCGHKEFWFAPGVGVVRFICDWGGFVQTDCVLSAYHTIAEENEYLPVHIGNRWQYIEKGLTAEGYMARRDYHVVYGMNKQYLLIDNQMFTFHGDTAAYDAFKARLAEKKE